MILMKADKEKGGKWSLSNLFWSSQYLDNFCIVFLFLLKVTAKDLTMLCPRGEFIPYFTSQKGE